jgi:tetratricopeptide (TPR) repeat protein
MMLFSVCALAQEPGLPDGPLGRYGFRALSVPNDNPMDEFHRIGEFNPPLVLDWPERPAAKPITGVVSLQQLRHPPQKKAIRDLLEAQQYSNAHDSPKAIDKLEEAIRIDPSIREAHINLGVQYARTDRLDEALGQFHTALEIGPEDAILYSNLAWGYAAIRDFRQAKIYASQAVAMDPKNGPAQSLLKLASAH